MATETNLRQATAKAYVTGELAEKKLDFYKTNAKGERTTENVSEADAEGITGYVGVRTSDTNVVRFNINVAKMTKNNTESKTYPGIKTVMQEYKSVAGLKEGETADLVTISGDINLYQNGQTGEPVVAFKCSYLNRVKDASTYEPKAEYDVEMFISKIVPETEMVDGEPQDTGRAKVTGWVPVYNGVEEITLIAEADVAEALSDYEPGMTVNFTGDIVSSRIVIKKEVPMRIGKKVKTEYINKDELIITGASEPYEEGVTEEKPYEMATIKAAVQERKERFEARKAKQNEPKAQTRPSAARTTGRTLGF